jgi:hypothetical protein
MNSISGLFKDKKMVMYAAMAAIVLGLILLRKKPATAVPAPKTVTKTVTKNVPVYRTRIIRIPTPPKKKKNPANPPPAN